MANIKFTSTELKSRIKEFVLAKLKRQIIEPGGFNGVDTATLKTLIQRAFPDATNAILLEIYNELKVSGTIEEITL